MSVLVNRCTACGHMHHPPRLLCPRCHGADFHAESVASGTIQAVSRLHRHTDPARLTVDLVQVAAGELTLLARAEAPVATGQRVQLSTDGQGAVVAMPVPDP